MNLIIKLSQANIELSKQEALNLIGFPKHKLRKNFLFVQTKNISNSIKQLKKSAFSKALYQPNKIPSKGSIRITKVTIEKTPKLAQGVNLIKHLHVDLKNPDYELCLLGFKKTLVALKIWENKERFEDRLPHKRPSSHPTTIHPRLARAMINLAEGQKVVDPFCGTGGILIEGVLTGKTMTGIDVDPLMLERVKKNLKYLNLKCEVILADSTSLKLKDAIVTDIPYGKSSKITKTQRELVSWLFKQQSKEIVLCTNKEVRAGTGFRKKHHFKIRIHKSMTRHIYKFQSSFILE